jgi:carbon storage regulator CsrA
MLILTRKLKEQIQIGDNIQITVLKISGRTVQIGIDAPREVRVKRAELKSEGAESPAAIEPGSCAASSPRSSLPLPATRDESSSLLPSDCSARLTSEVPTGVTDSTRRPVLAIGRRFRVLTPSQEGSSILRAVPLSE